MTKEESYNQGLPPEVRDRILGRWHNYVGLFGLAGDLLMNMLHGRDITKVPISEQERFRKELVERQKLIDELRGNW